MNESKLSTCRVPGPCWGCGSTIGEGHKYRKMVISEVDEYGPRRTVRVHPECYAILSTLTADEWDTFSPGDLDTVLEERDTGPKS